jgi:acyl dehydratase
VAVLPDLHLSAGTQSLTFTMTPIVPGQTVRVQRSVTGGWSTVTTRVVPSSGKLVLTGLVSGATYRIAVSASTLTIAATTSPATVR